MVVFTWAAALLVPLPVWFQDGKKLRYGPKGNASISVPFPTFAGEFLRYSIGFYAVIAMAVFAINVTLLGELRKTRDKVHIGVVVVVVTIDVAAAAIATNGH